MKLLTKTFVGIFLTLFLASCVSSESDYYTMQTFDDEPSYNIVEMKTTDPFGETFSFLFAKDAWVIEEWPAEEAPARVVLVHTAYEDRSCYLLPGSIGTGGEEGQQLVEGVLITSNGTAKKLDIYSSSGDKIKQIIGYEVDGIPYIFEINLPVSEPEQCQQDAQIVNASFKIVGAEEEIPEALDSVVESIEEVAEVEEEEPTVQ